MSEELRSDEVGSSTHPSSPDSPDGCSSTETQKVLKVLRLSPNATIPLRQTSQSIGYDLHSAEDTTVPPKGQATIRTDLQLGLPEGTYGRIAPRSGLAQEHFIGVAAGVVDRDYRGNVSVCLFNLGNASLVVETGMRIAQLILERAETPAVIEVSELEETERGANGFGSTGN